MQSWSIGWALAFQAREMGSIPVGCSTFHYTMAYKKITNKQVIQILKLHIKKLKEKPWFSFTDHKQLLNIVSLLQNKKTIKKGCNQLLSLDTMIRELIPINIYIWANNNK